jgi:predicted RNase H-like HicB family nuclease
MAQYVGILDGAKDVWGVRIPDVPGCHGGGSTPEAAIADAISALREYAAHQKAKGIALAPPRAVQDVMRDKAAEFDAKAGEAIVMVPLILDQARPVKANISLDAGLLEAIDEEAERRGLTRSALLTSAALDKIGQPPLRPVLHGRLYERDTPSLREHKEQESRKYLADAPARIMRDIVNIIERLPEEIRDDVRRMLSENLTEPRESKGKSAPKHREEKSATHRTRTKSS